MKRILPLFLALALLLTGCAAVSTTETTSQAVSQVDSPSSALESAPESASSQLESISITDSNGSQITLDTSAPRVVAASEPYPGRWTHHVLVTEADQIDEELMGWLREAWDFAESKR